MKKIRVRFEKILEKEYHNQYSPRRNIDEALRAIKQVNPHLATRAPTEALAAVREQFSAHMVSDSPFNSKRRVNQSLLKDRDSDLLRLAGMSTKLIASIFGLPPDAGVKIFSAVPTSIVDEHAMSVASQ